LTKSRRYYGVIFQSWLWFGNALECVAWKPFNILHGVLSPTHPKKHVSPPKVARLDEELREDPNLREVLETKHWLSLCGHGQNIFNEDGFNMIASFLRNLGCFPTIFQAFNCHKFKPKSTGKRFSSYLTSIPSLCHLVIPIYRRNISERKFLS